MKKKDTVDSLLNVLIFGLVVANIGIQIKNPINRLTKIRNKEFFERKDRIYVYFGRDTCNECNQFTKKLNEMDKYLPDPLYYFDTKYWRKKDEVFMESICNQFEVNGVPSIVIIENNQRIGDINIYNLMNNYENTKK